ncbi:glycosyltransferase family 2 protein [Chthonobacter rhizosphaerae]|uniref:glycosyltransferase family 2 protein n=1 Tax=Chthonobacter rhizosphaerae TaxID=2735553 RepID=UPI0015EE9196|nr:glycosyltransferase family 2 protein [Chthonobacter rhizosphaerae]
MSPRVSLGLPVYNGEKYVGGALECLLGQTFQDFELIISDNASTDRTGAICRSFAARDPRVKYLRNPHNLGAGPNFNHVFHQAVGTYFKWCACDDLLGPTFLAETVRALDENPDTVLAFGRTESIDDTAHIVPLVGSNMPAVLDERPARRFRQVLREIGTCYEVFGLIRRDALAATTLHRPYYGSDRALLLELSLLGKFRLVPDAVLYSREHPERSINIADKRDRARWHTSKARHSLEHTLLLGHLARILVRQRAVAPLSATAWPLLAFAASPIQVSRYALEAIGLVAPAARTHLRNVGWSAVHRLQNRRG